MQLVLATWGLAEAAAIHPDQLNDWTSCSGKTLRLLREWTFIRSTGYHPPEVARPGRKASDSEVQWASQPFQYF